MQKPMAHGEVMIVKASELGITEVPADAVEVKRDGAKRLLLAHSETGHHHYIATNGVRLFQDSYNPLIAYLKIDGAHALLEQAKSRADKDRHKDQTIPNGLYRVSKAREWTPEGWRIVQD